MFDQASETPVPWYRSWPGVLAASLLLPPLGIFLLLTRRDTDAQVKIIGSLLIALVGAGYLYLLLGPRRDAASDAHYAELERHRAAQQQQPGAPPADAQALNNAGQPAPPDAATGQAAQAGAGEQQPQQAAVAPVGPSAPPSAAQAPAQRGRRNYWTSFRGPSRDGRYDEQAVNTRWAAGGLPLLWRQPVGGGYASFAVADGVAYTVEQRRSQEVAAAYQLDTGRELWTHAWGGEFKDSTGDGPRATPTWDDGRLYVLGALGELRCLDAKTGKLIWNRNILSDNGAENLPWAMAASPLVVDDKVVVLAGGSSGKSVVAYNKATGAPAWKALSDQASYTSPMLVEVAGRRQILVITARRAAGLEPSDGAVLWEYPWANSAGINVSQPIVVGPNRVFLSAGYGKGAALVEVAPSGNGLAARTVWENTRLKNKFNSSVFQDGHVYGLDEGMLTCMDVATGEVKWKARGYGYGQVLLASGHLIVTSEEGDIALVRAAPSEHAEVARFKAFDGRTWNVPAIAAGRLLVRNQTEMACYKLAE